jgi:hypothetical protein
MIKRSEFFLLLEFKRFDWLGCRHLLQLGYSIVIIKWDERNRMKGGKALEDARRAGQCSFS